MNFRIGLRFERAAEVPKWQDHQKQVDTCDGYVTELGYKLVASLDVSDSARDTRHCEALIIKWPVNLY